MRIVVSMDVPKTIAAALGTEEICNDLRDAIINYVTTTMSDFEDSKDDPSIGETVELIIKDLALMRDSIDARAWGFADKVREAE